MKNLISTQIGLCLVMNLFSQSNKSFETDPNSMNFIPQGSFIMRVIENTDTIEASVSVDAFWMSNEITNLEYKEYVNYVKQNPNEKLCWVDLESGYMDKNESNTEKKQKYIICMNYSEILSDIIDSTKLPYPDYFINKKYENYPVVGISQRHAAFYCIWITKLENEKLQKEGKPAIHDYRLPVEAEWAYVAAKTASMKTKNIETTRINPSVSLKADDLGLYNLSGNVSEWTASTPKDRSGNYSNIKGQKELKIIRGGSWRTTLDTNERSILDQNFKDDYIGFRIVRSYLGN